MKSTLIGVAGALIITASCQNYTGNENSNSAENISDTNSTPDVNNNRLGLLDMRATSNDTKKTENNIPKKGSASNLSENNKKSFENTAVRNQTPVKTLKEAYKNYFPIGAAINPNKDLNDPATVTFIKQQFMSLTAKQAMQPSILQPKENNFNWTEADKLVDFASQNGLMVRGHCLIYASKDKHMPSWFYKDKNKPASKELILKRMKDHITAVVSRYKGKVYCWDVVNEAMRKTDSLYAILGEEYITKAFEYAHEADPSAKLFYNDGFYDDTQRTKFYTLLKKWKSQGVPIDGIGIQYHLGIEGKSAAEIQKDIDAFSSLGLEVQITELDISIYPRTSTPQTVKNASDSLTASIEDKQAAVYKTIFDVCRKNKGKITGITLWGTGDGDSFLVQRLQKKNYPYLFSNNLQPKKAFFNVVNF